MCEFTMGCDGEVKETWNGVRYCSKCGGEDFSDVIENKEPDNKDNNSGNSSWW